MTENNTRVVVIGGGYAGVMAANRLAPHARVTLVNPRASFVERIRLHQLVAGNDDAVADYSAVLSPAVPLVVDEAERIDAATRTVTLASGGSLDYDYLVYAVGSTGAMPASVPGAAEFTYPLSELEQAQRLAARMADVPLTAPVVVVGGGLTGIEAAAEFAEAGRPVTLVTDVLGPSLASSGRRSVTKRLAKLRVIVAEGSAVARVFADRVMLADGREVPSAVTVWTAGFGVPGLAAASGLSTDGLGRLLTDETLTSVDDARIIGAGDAVNPSNLPWRMSCQAALPLGAQAANAVLARLAGEEPGAVNHAMAAQCISLGRRAGTFQFADVDDTPRRWYIGGRSGALLKEQVCRWTLKWLRGEADKPGSYSWKTNPQRQQALAAAPTAEPVPR
ncbi:NAD(P)/FAD-dependent oxidoreductase [Mycolicibacterium celeriflavum]|uniref:Dehydrogenase n=1 Tax=Mycolicibacterium celeriflavum TaxID=1249101 RepID=A0A1X0BR96_MYCCF|nr:FAD-dependent oxidoreductase [Mycolicibacterium celeriflavum]MCV7237387.1 FAD-dependent oxidoreductase [Mycolicibacterium celeriflavum]ORA46013.1 FAD-dependent oxidoreductase [Mycolicibacterium celeriflavum]BBY45977.1 dehydrogenase [Mycolicibacterium celeriflavum]